MIFKGKKKRLDRYVRHMADLVGLRDWTLRVDVVSVVNATNHKYQGGECGASIEVSHGRKYAIIEIREDWATWDKDELRRLLTHELMHAHTAPMLWALHNIQAVTGGALFEALDNAFDDAHESAVDAIATEWAEFLPLPVKEKKRKEAA